MRTASIPFILAPVLASAQPLCDSLAIEGFTYDPFGNGLHIRLRNNSSQFLGDPHFDVLDDQGATIAEGQPFFFGVLPGDAQLHVLDVNGDLPPSPFSGALVFNFINADGEGSCTFPMDQVSLCPPGSCFPFQVYGISQTGPIDAELAWSIRDADNMVVDGGTLLFAVDGLVEVVDGTCLPPGAYNLQVQWPSPTGQPFQVGVTPSLFEVPPVSVVLPADGLVTMPFTLFAPCIDNAQAVEEAVDKPVVIAVDGRLVRLSSGDGLPLGDLVIMDAMGRTIGTVRAGGSMVVVDLGGASAGNYVLRSLDTHGAAIAKRFVML
jgi:hypothetical protein